MRLNLVFTRWSKKVTTPCCWSKPLIRRILVCTRAAPQTRPAKWNLQPTWPCTVSRKNHTHTLKMTKKKYPQLSVCPFRVSPFYDCSSSLHFFLLSFLRWFSLLSSVFIFFCVYLHFFKFYFQTTSKPLARARACVCFVARNRRAAFFYCSKQRQKKPISNLNSSLISLFQRIVAPSCQ